MGLFDSINPQMLSMILGAMDNGPHVGTNVAQSLQWRAEQDKAQQNQAAQERANQQAVQAAAQMGNQQLQNAPETMGLQGKLFDLILKGMQGGQPQVLGQPNMAQGQVPGAQGGMPIPQGQGQPMPAGTMPQAAPQDLRQPQAQPPMPSLNITDPASVAKAQGPNPLMAPPSLQNAVNMIYPASPVETHNVPEGAGPPTVADLSNQPQLSPEGATAQAPSPKAGVQEGGSPPSPPSQTPATSYFDSVKSYIKDVQDTLANGGNQFDAAALIAQYPDLAKRNPQLLASIISSQTNTRMSTAQKLVDKAIEHTEGIISHQQKLAEEREKGKFITPRAGAPIYDTINHRWIVPPEGMGTAQEGKPNFQQATIIRALEKRLGRPATEEEKNNALEASAIRLTGSKAEATEKAKQVGGFTEWTPQAKQQAFMYNLITKEPPVSTRGMAAGDRKVYAKEYSQWQVDSGFKPGDIALMQSDYRAGDMSLKNMAKQEAPMSAFVGNINKQIDKVQQLYSNNDRTGIRLLDKPIRDLKVLAVGSGDEAVKASYLLEISNEIGKLSSGASGSVQQLSDSAKEDWKKVHDVNLSLGEIMKVVNATRDQANMRMSSWREAKQEVRSMLSGIGSQGGGETPGPAQYDSMIESSAKKYGVDPQLVKSVIQTESNFNPKAVSPKGAKGLGQFMPGTAIQYGIKDPFDPQQSIDATAHYLADLSKQHKGDINSILMNYNAGNRVPKETADYVNKVKKAMGSGGGLSLKPSQQGQKLTDVGIVNQYIQQANGDKNKARELAKSDGWTF